MPGGPEQSVEIECPECGAHVKTTAKEVETGKIRCPRGHDVVVMGALGDVEHHYSSEKK